MCRQKNLKISSTELLLALLLVIFGRSSIPTEAQLLDSPRTSFSWLCEAVRAISVKGLRLPMPPCLRLTQWKQHSSGTGGEKKDKQTSSIDSFRARGFKRRKQRTPRGEVVFLATRWVRDTLHQTVMKSLIGFLACQLEALEVLREVRSSLELSLATQAERR